MNHSVTLERTPEKDYVPVCTCGWSGSAWPYRRRTKAETEGAAHLAKYLPVTVDHGD